MRDACVSVGCFGVLARARCRGETVRDIILPAVETTLFQEENLPCRVLKTRFNLSGMFRTYSRRNLHTLSTLNSSKEAPASHNHFVTPLLDPGPARKSISR